jgi:hypothetical protein
MVGPVGLESERLLLLDRTTERALGLGSWGDDDWGVWGGCGADLVLLRGVEFCAEPPWCADLSPDADE